MIGKINKGQFIGGLLDYHFKKIDEGVATLLDTNVLSEDKAVQKSVYLTTMDLNKDAKVKDKVFHASLNFALGEEIEDSKLVEIGNDYLERMGYKDVPYTIFKHTDKEHLHIHIVASRINTNGKISNVLAKKTKDITINMEQCQILERKYNLVIAKEQGSRKQRSLEEINQNKYLVANSLLKCIHSGSEVLSILPQSIKDEIMANPKLSDYELSKLNNKDYYRTKAILKKEQLLNPSKIGVLEEQLEESYLLAKDKNDFLERLNKKGIYNRYVKNGPKEYFVYGKAEEGIYIKDNTLSKHLRANSINNYVYTKSTKEIFDLKTEQKRQLNKDLFLIVSKCKSKLEFEVNLKQFGIEAIYSTTNKGKDIQGISFQLVGAEHQFKGSELNKKFSWSNINSQLKTNNSQQIIKDQKPKETKKTKTNVLTSQQQNNLSKIGKSVQRSMEDSQNTQGKSQAEREAAKRRGEENQEI